MPVRHWRYDRRRQPGAHGQIFRPLIGAVSRGRPTRRRKHEMAESIGSVLIIGATGQTGSALLSELLSAQSPIADRVVAYGNSRKPVLQGPQAGTAQAMQVFVHLLGDNDNDYHCMDFRA